MYCLKYAIIKKYKGIKILRQARKGKTAAQNLAAKHATGEILLFLDAGVDYPRNILKLINKDFSENIGLVSGSNFYRKFRR